MSKPLRTLLVLAVLSIIGMVALMMIAGRYGKIIQERQSPAASARRNAAPSSAATHWRGSATSSSRLRNPVPATARGSESAEEQAARYVDGFIQVRRALVEALRKLDPQSDADEQLRAVRDVAIGEAGLESGEYKQVRQFYGRWIARSGPIVAAFEQAFENRRDELASLRHERLEAL